jgi:hypothetical protein
MFCLKIVSGGQMLIIGVWCGPGLGEKERPINAGFQLGQSTLTGSMLDELGNTDELTVTRTFTE